MKNCENCGKILNDIRKKYCNNKCQKEHEWELKKERIKLGEIESPKALRRFTIERDGKSCKICGLEKWNGKDIPLDMDHIDGNNSNNFPINLRMICPNCDAQTDFYKGKNKGRGRVYRRKHQNCPVV